MRRIAPLAAIAALALASTALLGSSARDENKNRLAPDEADTGWKLLFDGKTMKGWGVTGNAQRWEVEDGAIAWKGSGGGMVYSKDRFKDFILRCQFLTAPRVNSGIFVRWEDLKDPVNTGIEVQVVDSFGRIKPDIHDCGGIYDIMPPAYDAVRPAGEWNDVEVTCQGPIVRVVLNAQQIVHLDLSAWTTPHQNPDGTKNKFPRAYNTMINEGHIGFQDHGGRVLYRSIRVKPLHPWATPVPG